MATKVAKVENMNVIHMYINYTVFVIFTWTLVVLHPDVAA